MESQELNSLKYTFDNFPGSACNEADLQMISVKSSKRIAKKSYNAMTSEFEALV